MSRSGRAKMEKLRSGYYKELREDGYDADQASEIAGDSAGKEAHARGWDISYEDDD